MQLLQEELGTVICRNISSLVPQGSVSARLATKMEIGNIVDEDFEDNLRAQPVKSDQGMPAIKKKNQTVLPQVRHKTALKKPVKFGESTKIEPLKEIVVNHRVKDVQFLDFKQRHGVQAPRYYSVLREMQAETINPRNENIIKQKIDQSEQVLMGLRGG